MELEILEAGDDILGKGDLTGDVTGGIIWYALAVMEGKDSGRDWAARILWLAIPSGCWM